MTVDFSFGKAPAVRVASLAWSGPWNEKRIRAQFGRIVAWAKSEGVRTGRWIFSEPGDRRWAVSIEIRGRARSGKGIRLRTLPAAHVAKVVFDPEVVAPRVIYHGLSDWLRWRRKDGEIRSVVSSREVYSDDPWRSARAWKNTEVQFVVRR
jgi:effector-binding domain-containing protein